MGGGVAKKYARGVKRQLSRKRDAAKRTNSVTGEGGDCGRTEGDETKTDTDDNANSLGIDHPNIVKQRRKLKAVKVDASNEDSVRTGRGSDLYNPPSPAGSCDSFSSNEPLMSLQREVKPNYPATDKHTIAKELPVTFIKDDEADKKECVALKSIVASPAMGLTVGITSVSVDENSSKLDRSADMETVMICANGNHVAGDSTMGVAGVKENTPQILNGVALASVQDQVSSVVMQASLPQQERNESQTIQGEKQMRRHYKRRSALELLNDVDGPPSRVSRVMQVKDMRRRSKEKVDAPKTLPAADCLPGVAGSLPSVSPAACVKGRVATPEKTDQDNECKKVGDVEVKLPEKFAEDLGKEDDETSRASIVEVENCTMELQKPPVERSGKGLNVKRADIQVEETKKGPGRPRMKHKGLKRKYSGIRQGNDALTSTEHPPGKKMLANNVTSTEVSKTIDKPWSRAALLPKSYSVKRMATRGKKNRYWYLFAKQSKKVRGTRDVETECVSRGGKETDLLAECRPCRVMLVDFLRCQKIGRLMALAAEGDDSTDKGVCKPTGLETTEPATKVAKVDSDASLREKRIGECLGVAACHDGSSVLTLRPTGSSSVQTDASRASTSSSGDVDRISAARIPRTVCSADPRQLYSRHQRFRCNHCSFKTSVRIVMDQHINTHSNIEPYLCGHCHKAFDTRDNVVTHTKQDHHGQLYSIVRRRELADGADYTTQYVRRKKPVPVVMSTESLQLDGDRPRVRPRIPVLNAVNPHQPYYQCKRCTYATNSVVTMQHHVLDVHSGDRRLICPLCDRAYCKTGHGMTKHYKRWHGDSVVQLRYEPDYYEVWDIKEAEANGVDAACSIRLPGPDSAHFDGQPLIGQPLILQPGQTFPSQKGLSSELPHPLTLQPSVRTLSKGRASTDTAMDKKVTLAVLSPEEPLNKPAIVRHELLAHYQDDGRVKPSVPVSCSAEAPVAHQNSSSTMPLLLAVDSYTVPPRQFTADKADEPIALTMDSPNGLRDADRTRIFAENVLNGTDLSSAHSLKTATCLTTGRVLQMDTIKWSSADIDDVPALIKGDYGSAGVLDTMPHLEKVSVLAFMWDRRFL